MPKGKKKKLTKAVDKAMLLMVELGADEALSIDKAVGTIIKMLAASRHQLEQANYTIEQLSNSSDMDVNDIAVAITHARRLSEGHTGGCPAKDGPYVSCRCGYYEAARSLDRLERAKVSSPS